MPLPFLLLVPPEFPVARYGARGDGRTMDTAAIQRAIDAASAAGGGRVVLPKGRFLSGTLFLKSGVELRIESGATLLGSANRDDYRKVRWHALILADGQKEIAITGGGTVDGQGQALAADVVRRWRAGEYGPTSGASRPGEAERPELLDFANCRGVRVEGVTLRNSSCWVQTYDRCQDVVVGGVRVVSRAYWNNDGLDLVDCRKALIENLDVDSADDGICLKSAAGGGGCEDVLVRNCRIRSSASAVKFGTGSYDGFRRIRVEGIDVRDTFRSAIALEEVDGGVLEDVTVRHVRARNVGNAFFVRLGERTRGAGKSALRNVLIEDLQATIPAGKPDAGLAYEGPPALEKTNPPPASIVGLPSQPIFLVTLRDVRVTTAGVADPARAVPQEKIPPRTADYPEFSMFGELPASGLYAQYVNGLTLDRVEFLRKGDDFRPAVYLDWVWNADLTGLRLPSPGEGPGLTQRHAAGTRGKT